jgi:Sulfatase-modifying factor enzyme 1/AAA ATPase domain
LLHLHVFLSSPGDVAHERQLARAVMDQLQSERAHRDRLKIEVVAWDKPGAGAPMPAQYEPQEAIDLGLKKPSGCDIVVVVLWARMGTPLSEKHRKPDGRPYRSGTEYEFLDALGASERTGKPDVLVYRRKGAPDINAADPQRREKIEQWDRVEEFFAEFRNPDGSFRRFWKEYEGPSDFEKLLDQDLRDLVTRRLQAQPAAEARPAPATLEPVWTESPYPGLRAFTPEEALIFFGRGRETDELVRRIGEPRSRFVAVVGPSGSGKSSLVAAGLLPALRKDAVPGGREWVDVRFTPGELGDNPFMALASGFKDALKRRGRLVRDEAAALEADPASFATLSSLPLGGRPSHAELLLFVDQLEELFTVVAAEHRAAFVQLLAGAVATERVRTVATLRADFYHRCLEWPDLVALLAQGQVPLSTPRVGALHEMITRPARQVGLRFDEGLAQRVLDDTGTEPGALPLMAFALSGLWKSRTPDGRLTRDAYESFGGVPGAIGKRVEETFERVSKEKKFPTEILEAGLAEVFREMVEVDESGVATRRRAPLSQLTGSAAAAEMVEALTGARLLVRGRGPGDAPMVEVAHEAILTSWGRLRDWVETRRDDLRLLRQVRVAAGEWERSGRQKTYLWPHERLVPVQQMLERLRPSLDPVEHAFVRPEADRLREEIEHPSTPHQRRAAIGDRLAEIGDPRPAVGLRSDGLPDIAWCEVPGGVVWLEDVEGMFPLTRFRIARYPVTWAQYRSFLEAEDGYRQREWWEGLSEKGEREPGTQFRPLDNHPAENVSWYDAVAFCRWLSRRLEQEIRLPTEWEWQQAATGGDPANVYPWGPEWDATRANTGESRLSRTTAVGLYPQGAWPGGPLDMSGNVLEWCLNEHEDPRRIGTEGDASRVVRGGSWFSDPPSARSAVRNLCVPVDRYAFPGFQVACPSPISPGV